MPMEKNTDPKEVVAGQRLALAVETLSNIHYLMEQSCDDPDSVKKFVEMAEAAMEVLRDFAWQRERKSSIQPVVLKAPRSSSPATADDHADQLPLAAAGEDSPTSGAEAPPEIRVDRLEAD